MKGVVLRNCGALGLDWERLSLSGYVEAMNAGERDDGEVTITADVSRLKRFMAAHGGNA